LLITFSTLLRRIKSLQQLLKSRIAAQRVKERIGFYQKKPKIASGGPVF